MDKLYKIANWLSKKIGVRSDYILHFGVGFVFGLLYLALPFWSVLIFASIIFIAKEIYDVYKPDPSGFSLLDLLADYLGLFTSTLLVWLIL